MSGVRYLPGEDWLSVVRGGVVVLVPAGTAPEVLDRLWNQLGENPHLQAVLPIVAGGFGQGIESMPPFGVVSYTDRLHVLLRGAVRLTVAPDGSAAPVELSGEDVTTWTERIIDGGGFTLRAGPDRTAEDAPAFPLEAGIVRASGVSVNSLDPERAMTGALEAEESATINPSLYLTSADSSGNDGNDPTGGNPTDNGSTVDDGAPDAGAAGGQDPDLQAPGGRTPRVQLVQDLNSQDPDPDPESQSTGYDHLWDRTVVRRVEDAAVRPPEEDDLPAAPDAPSPEAPVAESVPESEPKPRPEPAAPSEPGPTPGPTPIPVSAPGELIDSVPWIRRSPETDSPAAPLPVPHGEPVPTPPSAGRDSDHDGHTIMRSDLHTAAPSQPGSTPHPGSSAQPGSTPQPGSEVRPGTGPLVLARLCGQGHANPPEAPECGLCSQPLDGEPCRVRRPSLGTMRISTGEVVELDQSLIIGRQPSVSRVQGSGMPKLVQVTSAGGDISRSHVEVRLDGWHVLLCDLKATNGTVLIRAGQPPRRLGEGESAFLLDGDVAQLGDDVFLRFEGLR